MSQYEGYAFGQSVKQRVQHYDSPTGAGSPVQSSVRSAAVPPTGNSSATYDALPNFAGGPSQSSPSSVGRTSSNPMLLAKPVGFRPVTQGAAPTHQPTVPSSSPNYASFVPWSSTEAPPTQPPGQPGPGTPPVNSPSLSGGANRPVSMPPRSPQPTVVRTNSSGLNIASNAAYSALPSYTAAPAPTTPPVSLSTGVVRQAQSGTIPKIPANVPVLSRPPVIPKIPASIPVVSMPPKIPATTQPPQNLAAQMSRPIELQPAQVRAPVAHKSLDTERGLAKLRPHSMHLPPGALLSQQLMQEQQGDDASPLPSPSSLGAPPPYVPPSPRSEDTNIVNGPPQSNYGSILALPEPAAPAPAPAPVVPHQQDPPKPVASPPQRPPEPTYGPIFGHPAFNVPGLQQGPPTEPGLARPVLLAQPSAPKPEPVASMPPPQQAPTPAFIPTLPTQSQFQPPPAGPRPTLGAQSQLRSFIPGGSGTSAPGLPPPRPVTLPPGGLPPLRPGLGGKTSPTPALAEAPAAATQPSQPSPQRQAVPAQQEPAQPRVSPRAQHVEQLVVPDPSVVAPVPILDSPPIQPRNLANSQPGAPESEKSSRRLTWSPNAAAAQATTASDAAAGGGANRPKLVKSEHATFVRSPSATLQQQQQQQPQITRVPAAAAPSAQLRSSQSASAVSAPSPALYMRWNEIDWNGIDVTRQAIYDIKAIGQAEIARVQAVADKWEKEAMELKRELQNMRLQRLRDPSLLRPNITEWVQTIQADPAQVEVIKRIQKRSKMILLRLRWRSLVADYTKSEESKTIRRRIDICKEILSSERQYVEYLWNLINSYKRAFDSAIADGSLPQALKETPEKLRKWCDSIFINAPEILNFHTGVLATLQDQWKKWPGKPVKLGEFFCSIASDLKIYSKFVNRYDEAIALFAQLIKKSAIRSLFEEVQKKPSVRKMPVEMYLIMPVQRIPRYELLLRELLKFTPENHVDYEGVKRALQQFSELASWINEEKRRWESTEVLRHIVDSLQNCPANRVLSDPERRLVRKGKVGAGAKKKKFYLLTDMLLIGSAQGVCEAVIDLHAAQLTDDAKTTTLSIWFVGPNQAVESFIVDCGTNDAKNELKAAVLARIALLIHQSS